MNKLLVSIVSFCVAFMALRTQSEAGIVPTLLETESGVTHASVGSEFAYFGFRFSIEAVDEDAYVLFAGLDLNIIPDHYDYDLWIHLSSDASIVSGDRGERFFLIEEGREEIFNYLILFRPNVDSLVQGGIKYIGWNDVPSSEAPFDSWGGESEEVNWRGDMVFVPGSPTPEPGTALLTLIGGVALASRRRRN